MGAHSYPTTVTWHEKHILRATDTEIGIYTSAVLPTHGAKPRVYALTPSLTQTQGNEMENCLRSRLQYCLIIPGPGSTASYWSSSEITVLITVTVNYPTGCHKDTETLSKGEKTARIL